MRTNFRLVVLGITMLGLTACGQSPALIVSSPAPTPTSEPQDLDDINLDDIGLSEMAKIEAEFSGTDSLDAFDQELSQVDIGDGSDTILSQIEAEL